MKIGLIGNQNCGKTTLFNCLTGMNAKIGNWPGVTIEKKVGTIIGTDYELTDLPGVYSLSPYSMEEDVSRRFIMNEKPDVIINIIDATSLERSLYLTTQLLELDTKIIIALNMYDILEKKGVIIDPLKLEKTLGVKVVQVSALKKVGIDELINEIPKAKEHEKLPIFDSKIENLCLNISSNLSNEIQNKRMIAIKLIEGDERFLNYLNQRISADIHDLEKEYDTDFEEIIATERYNFIENVRKSVLIKKELPESISDKLDKIFLNRYLAFPIFAGIMFLVYYVSVGVVGSFTVDFIENMIENLSTFLENWLVRNKLQWMASKFNC